MRQLALSLWLPLVLAAPPAAAARAPIVELDRIVAVVNDNIVTESELEQRLAETRQQLAAQRIDAPPDDVLRRQLLERIVIEEIQLQLAAQTGIRVGRQDVERAIEAIGRRNRMSVEQIYDTVRDQGFRRQAYRDQIRKQLIIQRLVEREISSKISVSETEVANFLERARARARPDEEYNVSHIYVPFPESASKERTAASRSTASPNASIDVPPSKERIAAAREQAEEIRQRLLAGADFARMAVSHSQGPDALRGGALGWKGAGQLPELFLKALEALPVGGVSEVLRGPNGFHLLRLNDRRGGAVAAEAETVRETLVRHILLQPNEIQSASDARLRLLELKRRLAAGEDFATLARTYSEDAISAAKGGELGWVAPDQLVPAFERAMNALEPGETSEPVQTPFGLHLIQVLDRRERTVTAERERAAARRQVRARKENDRYEQWVRQLRDEAYVEYLLDDLD